MKYFYIILTLCFVSCVFISNKNETVRKEVIFENINASFQKQQKKIKKKLNLKEVILKGSIETQNNKWFILKGVFKDSTYQSIGIYVYPLKKSSVPDSTLKRTYSYPGKEYSFDGVLIYESRVFFGKCTDKYNNSIIWYQRELINEKWVTNYYVIEFKNDIPFYKSLKEDKIKIKEILNNKIKGICEEIPGEEYYDEP